jgi:hypothetical protein
MVAHAVWALIVFKRLIRWSVLNLGGFNTVYKYKIEWWTELD